MLGWAGDLLTAVGSPVIMLFCCPLMLSSGMLPLPTDMPAAADTALWSLIWQSERAAVVADGIVGLLWHYPAAGYPAALTAGTAAAGLLPLLTAVTVAR